MKIMIIEVMLLAICSPNKFLFLNFAQSLYIPGHAFSQINVTHDFNSFEAKLFDIQINFNLTQVKRYLMKTTQFNQTNSVFDFLEVSQSEYIPFISCYYENMNYISNLYKLYKPCQQICSFSDISTFSSQYFKPDLSMTIGNNQNTESQQSFIIDNTLYPCQNGAYQPQLYLWEAIDITIQQNQTYQLIVKIVCLSLLQILLILISYLLIMMSKYKKLKGKLSKIRGEQQAQEMLDSFMPG